jgi:sodium transport system permease protein
MNWPNVKLILSREIRDQLRDRRTMFMIFVLPVLLYPLLGMSGLQMLQFVQKTSRVLVVGAEGLGNSQELIQDGRFNEQLFSDPSHMRRLELHFADDGTGAEQPSAADPQADARAAVLAGRYDAAVCFPPDFAKQLDAFRKAVRGQAEQRRQQGHLTPADEPPLPVPGPKIIHASTEKSEIAFARVSTILERWAEEVGKGNLAASGVPVSAARPFDLKDDKVMGSGPRGPSVWSKILPVLLAIWALTGAFYPAVDLCAGEKERGTLETLLSSPAGRSEIVLGKLLTIMLFSMATAVLNLASIGMTGSLIASQFPHAQTSFPIVGVVWLVVALVPISALFSALCLALAALARSTKEGQYYLMPLLLVTIPLVVLPMAPGAELSLGNSLIPVTGAVLLLRSLLEGNYMRALEMGPIVVAVTSAACLLAARWAVEQFNSETVLFRSGEQLDVRLWFRHLVRDRQPTPTVAAAVACGLIILMARFVSNFAVGSVTGFGDFARVTVLTQVAVIALPAVAMTLLLTRSPRQTLLLRMPNWPAVPAAVLLAAALHPVVRSLQAVVEWLYPAGDELTQSFKGVERLFVDAPFWPLVLVLCVVPAICEELAFRGFILSGFCRMGTKGRAILYSAIFFGLTHTILQQSLIACLVGVVVGLLAVQTRSLLPGVLFHLTHNLLILAAARLTPEVVDRWPVLRLLVLSEDGRGHGVPWFLVAVGGLVAIVILRWLSALGEDYRTPRDEHPSPEAVALRKEPAAVSP